MAPADLRIIGDPGPEDPPDLQPRPHAVVTGSDGIVRTCSDELAHFLGFSSAEEVVGRRFDELLTGQVRRRLLAAASDAISTGLTVGPIDVWFDRGDTVALGRLWVAEEPLGSGCVVARGLDLTDLPMPERAAALEAMLLERAVGADDAPDVRRWLARLIEWFLPGARCSIGVVDDDGVIRHRDAPTLPEAVVWALDGMSPDSQLAAAARRAHGMLVAADLGEDQTIAVAAARSEPGLSQIWTLRVEHPDGGLAGMVAVFAPASLDPDPATVGLLRRTADLAGLAARREHTERSLVHEARYDTLTGLPNRRQLLERIAELIDRGRPGRLAVCVVDIDDFTLANDSYSHAAGDEVLVRVGRLLRGQARPTDLVGRLGGDEFVLVTRVADPIEALARGEAVRAALDTAVPVGEIDIRVSATVGLSVDEGVGDADALLADAGAALHLAQRTGRNHVVLFEPEVRAAVQDRVSLESGLRRVLRDRLLEVHFQPIVDASGGGVVALEALARWPSAGAGPSVGPTEFVRLAEETGLIHELGGLVLRDAARCAARLHRSGWPDLVVAVNVSAHQLGGDLVDTVAAVLGETGLAPTGLCLEVTESALAWPQANEVVGDLVRLGVAVAIDDFGTGYSSLDHLRRFPAASVLKIDSSFVADLQPGAEARAAATVPDIPARAIVQAAIVLGHSLGMTVVAEGVETQAQRDVLIGLGCDRIQGFLLGAAVPADDLPATLAQVVARSASG